MQGRGNLIVGLDIGTTKICCVVGELSQGDVNVLGRYRFLFTNPGGRGAQLCP